MYLLEPYLTTEGRRNYKQAVISELKTIDEIRYDFADAGRIERIRRCLIVTCHLLHSIIAAQGEPGWN